MHFFQLGTEKDPDILELLKEVPLPARGIDWFAEVSCGAALAQEFVKPSFFYFVFQSDYRIQKVSLKI